MALNKSFYLLTYLLTYDAHQISNFGAVGAKDKLFRFEIKRSEVKATGKIEIL